MSTDPEDPGSFLERWSRRKADARRAPPTPSADGPPGSTGAAPEATATTATDPALDAPAADDRPLPSLDDITPSGNIAAFLEKRIPAELQRMALRKAWASDPAIAGFIEIAENQWDWNTPGGAPGWGDLDAGTDLEMLLAQATGRLPPPVDEAASTNGDDLPQEHCDSPPQPQHAADASALSAEDTASHNERPADDELSAIVRTPDATKPPALLGEDRAPVAATIDIPEKAQRLATQHSPPSPSRRHGGALPRS